MVLVAETHIEEGDTQMNLEPFTPETCETLEKIFEKYKLLIWKIANNILKDPDLMEDCLQETMLKLVSVADKLQRHEYGDNERAYILAVARNQAFDMLEKKKREIPADDDEMLGLILDGVTSGRDRYFMEANGYSKEVNDCLRSLSPKDLEVIMLRQTYNLSNIEIAKITHENSATVAQRYHRAKGRLRKALADSYKED